MPRRHGEQTYGEKLTIVLMRLLLANRSVSVKDLQKELGVADSRAVMRIIRSIEGARRVPIVYSSDGRNRTFQLESSYRLPPQTLEKGAVCLLQSRLAGDHLAHFEMGGIDYSLHYKTIEILMEALQHQRACDLTYRTAAAREYRPRRIMPYKVFSYQGGIYVHGDLVRSFPQPDFRADGKIAPQAVYTSLLAVHRIGEIQLTDETYTLPEDYDFDAVFNRSFGVIKGKSFVVEVELSGFAAFYAAERVWSPNQKISKRRNGRTRMTFTASSEPEVTAWILSFGREARLIRPKWLKQEISRNVKDMYNAYFKP